MKIEAFQNVILGSGKTCGISPVYQPFLNSDDLPDFCLHYRAGKTVRLNPEHNTPAQTNAPLLTAEDGERYLFGGRLVWHFGHFLAENAHRLWPYEREAFKDATALFVCPNPDLIDQTVFRDVMAYFHVKKWRLITDAVCVEHLWVPESGSFLGQKPKPDYVDFLMRNWQRLQETARPHTPDLSHRSRQTADKPADGRSGAKLAILRSHRPRGGRLLAEPTLARFLTGQGYVLFEPEKHSLSEQLSALASAEKIVISEGSACHLFDLLPPISAKVAYLSRRTTLRMFQTSVAPKAKRAVAFNDIRVLASALGKNGKRRKSVSIAYAPVGRLKRFLAQHDFISADAPLIPEPDYRQEISTFVAQHEIHGRDPGSQANKAEIVADLMRMIDDHPHHTGYLARIVTLISGITRTLTKRSKAR